MVNLLEGMRKPLAILFLGYVLGYTFTMFIFQMFYQVGLFDSIFWILRKTLVLILLFMGQLKHFNVKFGKVFIVGMIVFLTVQVGLFLCGINFRVTFGFKWSWIAMIEYTFFGIVYFIGFKKILASDYDALTFMLGFLLVVGLLYEFPATIGKSGFNTRFYHVSNPFIVSERLFFGILICWNIGFEALKKKIFALVFMVWLAFQVNLFFNSASFQVYPQAWLMRLPTLLLGAFILYLRGQSRNA